MFHNNTTTKQQRDFQLYLALVVKCLCTISLYTYNTIHYKIFTVCTLFKYPKHEHHFQITLRFTLLYFHWFNIMKCLYFPFFPMFFTFCVRLCILWFFFNDCIYVLIQNCFPTLLSLGFFFLVYTDAILHNWRLCIVSRRISFIDKRARNAKIANNVNYCVMMLNLLVLNQTYYSYINPIPPIVSLLFSRRNYKPKEGICNSV